MLLIGSPFSGYRGFAQKLMRCRVRTAGATPFFGVFVQGLFDRKKTEPRDGAIVLVRDGNRYVARVARRAEGGLVFCAEGHPTLTGARRVYGTLAGLVRAYEAEAVIQPYATVREVAK